MVFCSGKAGIKTALRCFIILCFLPILILSKQLREQEDEMFTKMTRSKHSRLSLPIRISDVQQLSVLVEDSMDCTLECLGQPWCHSFNLKTKAEKNGMHVCELLSTDRFNHSEFFTSEKEFEHFSIKNPCENIPCSAHGRCVALYAKQDYYCACASGYIGRNCETDVDECEGQHGCHGNAQCTNIPGSYVCKCNDGYTGDGSQCKDIDECASSPCQNDGTCTNHVNKYKCTCAPGYGGNNCQTDMNECASNPCRNGGTCTDHVNRYTCACVAGYAGTNCQTDINECASNPCRNRGICTDHVNRYTCTCAAGYAGINCLTDINECASNPCRNGGTCTDHVNRYICTCAAGYVGTNCQTDINECASNPCRNRGICTDHVNRYTCTCAAGYAGTNCQTDVNECASNPCQNGGNCVDKVNSFSCTCIAGFAGSRCETNINECASSPCKNGRTCSDHVNRYTCTCAPGYTGTNCQHPTDGSYQITVGYSRFWVYHDITSDGRAWKLIARFSNADNKNWMRTDGYWWYDQRSAVGHCTTPFTNADMISPAFWSVTGKEFKITRSDDSSNIALLVTTGNCLGGQTFRAKMSGYGNFRNGRVWASNRCLGSCQVQYGGQYSSTHGFEKAGCSSNIQSWDRIGFWCDWDGGDGAVLMIGGGGPGCDRADHGIGITEEGDASFKHGDAHYDFGCNPTSGSYTQPNLPYSLNLWVGG